MMSSPPETGLGDLLGPARVWAKPPVMRTSPRDLTLPSSSDVAKTRLGCLSASHAWLSSASAVTGGAPDFEQAVEHGAHEGAGQDVLTAETTRAYVRWADGRIGGRL